MKRKLIGTEINKETLETAGWKQVNDKGFYMKGDFVIIKEGDQCGFVTYNGKISPSKSMKTIEELENTVYRLYSNQEERLEKVRETLKLFKHE